MGCEKSLWRTLQKNMKGRWEADRVENPANPGTPDVFYSIEWALGSSVGWIELKYIPEWPKRKSTALKIDHFTVQQKSFFKRHGKRDTNIYMLLQVERDYLLLYWFTALKIGTLTKHFLIKESAAHWKNKIDYDQLAFCLI